MRQLKIVKQVTNRESKSLNNYLTDISKLELITAEEEVELAQRIRNGDNRALEALTKANLRFVVSVAKQYQNQGLSLPDLINEGNLGLVKAAKRFDETRGFKFISYAVWWIRQAIMAAISEHSRTVRIPLNKIGEISKMNKAKLVLQQHLERTPTASELAHDLGISVDRLKSNQTSGARSLSLDAPMGGDESDFNFYNVLESSSVPRPDTQLMRESLQTEIDRALDTLPDREAQILKMNFGLNEHKSASLAEIGEMFELSRERVRQIREKAIRQLRKKSKSEILMGYLG